MLRRSRLNFFAANFSSAQLLESSPKRPHLLLKMANSRELLVRFACFARSVPASVQTKRSSGYAAKRGQNLKENRLLWRDDSQEMASRETARFTLARFLTRRKATLSFRFRSPQNGGSPPHRQGGRGQLQCIITCQL